MRQQDGEGMKKRRKESDTKKPADKLEITLSFSSFLVTPMTVHDHLPAKHCSTGSACRRARPTVSLPGPRPPAVT